MHKYSFHPFECACLCCCVFSHCQSFVPLARRCLYRSSVVIPGLLLFHRPCKHNTVCCCWFPPSSMHLTAFSPFIQRHPMKLKWHSPKVELGLPSIAAYRDKLSRMRFIYCLLSPLPHAHTHSQAQLKSHLFIHLLLFL